jgi:hypothetical protein
VENLRDGVESFVIFGKMILYANNKKYFLSSANVVMVFFVSNVVLYLLSI